MKLEKVYQRYGFIKNLNISTKISSNNNKDIMIQVSPEYTVSKFIYKEIHIL
jgi:hypothetical protein